MSRHQAEFFSLDEEFAPFFHALRNDAERFDRRFEARDGRHGSFQADVVGTRGARFDADTLAGRAIASVKGRAPGHREVRLKSFEFANRLTVIPKGEQIENTPADRGGVEYAAVEENRGWPQVVRVFGTGSHEGLERVARLYIRQAAHRETARGAC